MSVDKRYLTEYIRYLRDICRVHLLFPESESVMYKHKFKENMFWSSNKTKDYSNI